MWDLDTLAQWTTENPKHADYIIKNVYAMAKREMVSKKYDCQFSVCEWKFPESFSDEEWEYTKNFILSSLKSKYPDVERWFSEKVVLGLNNGERKLFLLHRGMELIGFCITKKCFNKVKICSLFIGEKYRRQGLGTTILQKVISTYPHKTYFYISFRTFFDGVSGVRAFMAFNGFNVRDHISYASPHNTDMVDTYYYMIKDEKFY